MKYPSRENLFKHMVESGFNFELDTFDKVEAVLISEWPEYESFADG